MGLTKVNHPDLLDLASDTGATVFPKGTTAERPVTPEAGYIRFNTTDNVMETYDGTEWVTLDTLAEPILPYTVDYLVVAGGGGGGDSGSTGDGAGGGGAGGLRTSYGTISGGNSSVEPSIELIPLTEYTITVGAGGALSSNGDNSAFSDIISLGGGSGANASGNGFAGGSGGGGSCSGSAKIGGAGTTGQGFEGASQEASNSYACGGGGGAGEVGQQGHPNNGPVRINRGGNGLYNSITGANIAYAGGGGGGSGWFAGSEYVAPAIGGGGVGAWGDPLSDPTPDNDRATAGGVNLGGGGGGSTAREYRRFGGKPGGSGVVILRMPTAKYSGTTTGSPTVTTDGSDTILTYTSSGTYTA